MKIAARRQMSVVRRLSMTDGARAATANPGGVIPSAAIPIFVLGSEQSLIGTALKIDNPSPDHSPTRRGETCTPL